MQPLPAYVRLLMHPDFYAILLDEHNVHNYTLYVQTKGNKILHASIARDVLEDTTEAADLLDLVNNMCKQLVYKLDEGYTSGQSHNNSPKGTKP